MRELGITKVEEQVKIDKEDLDVHGTGCLNDCSRILYATYYANCHVSSSVRRYCFSPNPFASTAN
jgi:hypothetical protein